MAELANGGPAPRVWSVAGLVLALADALAARFGACTVRGELSGFSRAASGHCYFSLKDADGAQASLRCAMFRRAATLVDFVPMDGQQVELRGRLTVYEARGELQFVAESMRSAGAGSLYEQFLRLKARLEGEGLFAAERKRALPPFPQRIGVITSLGAAALHDVLSALQRRAPHVQAIIYPSLVQGTEAPAALVAALGLAAARREVDCIILARGGGSLEDLWAFNDERVVRAVAACPLPLICGVGHETDLTLADLAADLRAPTPTAAAELAAPAASDMRVVLQGLARGLARGAERSLQARAQRLDRLSPRLGQPAARLVLQARRLDHLASRLAAATVQAGHAQRLGLAAAASRLQRVLHDGLAKQEHRLATLHARLQALAPQRVIERGYSLVQTVQGTLLSDPRQLSAGQALRLTMARGEAAVVLAEVKPLEK